MFGKIVGLSPKQYCKVIQFNAVFDAINKGNAKEIHDLALKHGYYDQAHFIHDFKMRLGQSPQAFFKSRHYFLRHYLGSFINQ
jgi:AraC-like DNA-binding protein